MSKKKPIDASQLSLDSLLEQEPDILHRLPIEPNDIGGELLAVLSKGLYTNPLDCIREYIQNSVDGRAQDVTIKITGNSVMIFDDGNGMNLEELLQARQFGLSPKIYTEHVGFRGIGIYSGFDLCRRLRITSTKAGDPHVHVMVFEFAEMKSQLDAERGRSTSETKTSLIRLLSEHTFIKRESAGYSVDSHFTQVELQDIADFHIRQLSNRSELRRYLLQNLPIDFADAFVHKQSINSHLAQHVLGYHPIHITLQSDGQPDDIVSKYDGMDVQAPKFGYIHTEAGQPLAYYWACLNTQRGHIDKVAHADGTQYEGFIYKAKGFSIGDRHRLREMFGRKPQLYPWYTGEIYVTHPAIVPNAERDDFESSPTKNALQFAIRTEVDKVLIPDAETFQAEGVAHDRIRKYKDELSQVETSLQGAPVSSAEAFVTDLDTYSRLDDILRDVKRQKKGASLEDRPDAEDIIRRAERLQKQLRREAEAPVPTDTQPPSPKGRKGTSRPITGQLPIPLPPPEARTLASIIEEGGWPVDESCARLILVLQESLDEVLGVSSAAYGRLMTSFESKLSNLTLDE